MAALPEPLRVRELIAGLSPCSSNAWPATVGALVLCLILAITTGILRGFNALLVMALFPASQDETPV